MHGVNSSGSPRAVRVNDSGELLVNGLTPGTGATDLGKAEDAVHASGDTGVMLLAVRKDTAAAVAADGDYIPVIVDATGRLWTIPQGDVAHDAVDAGNPLKIGGKAATVLPTAVAAADRVNAYFDEYGRLHVVAEPNTKTTYAAGLVGVAPAVAATDVFTITGSGTKTVRVRRMAVSGIATAAGAYVFQLLKRSTANSAGTSTSAVRVPLDSGYGAATATVLGYTANPTVGTEVGIVSVKRATVTTAAGAIPQVIWEFDFTEHPVVLRGIAEVLALSLNGVTMTGGALDCYVEWTEE